MEGFRPRDGSQFSLSVEIGRLDDVLVHHPDATGRNGMPDRFGLVGAVNAERGALAILKILNHNQCNDIRLLRSSS